MKIWKTKGRKWSYLAWVRIYWSRDNCLSRYHGWSSVGREVSGVRDAEFLSVLYHRVSVAGLANGLNGEEKGGADVRAGEDATGDQEGVEDWSAGCRLWQEVWKWSFCRSKVEDTKFWPQCLALGPPTICWPMSWNFTVVSVSDFIVWSWLWNSTLHSCCECNQTVNLVAIHCPCSCGNTIQLVWSVQLPVSGLCLNHLPSPV